jgi:hypothetical protein
MKLGKLKIALQKILAETFAQVSTDKGILAWDGEAQMPEVGESVYSFDDEGNQISVEDGDYVLDDGTTIVVVDGKVSEIRDPEKGDTEQPTEEAPAEEGEGGDEGGDENVEPVEEDADEAPAQEEEQPVDDRDERIANLEAEIARLEEENGALKERIKELENKPAAEPAEEEFKRVNKLESTGNKRLDNLTRILNA